MNKDSLRTLKILDELSHPGRITQRELSKRVGIALGLTNLYLRRLVRKGYLKASNIEKNRLKYLLTPRGVAEKAALTVGFLQNSFRYYRSVRTTMRVAFEALLREGCRSVVLFGTGEVAEIAYLSLREADLHLVAIVDSKRAGENFCGYKIAPPSALKELNFDKLIIIALDESDGTCQRLLMYGVNKEKVFRVQLIDRADHKLG